MRNALGEAVWGLGENLSGEEVGLGDYVKLVQLRHELDDGNSAGTVVTGWRLQCTNERSSTEE